MTENSLTLPAGCQLTTSCASLVSVNVCSTQLYSTIFTGRSFKPNSPDVLLNICGIHLKDWHSVRALDLRWKSLKSRRNLREEVFTWWSSCATDFYGKTSQLFIQGNTTSCNTAGLTFFVFEFLFEFYQGCQQKKLTNVCTWNSSGKDPRRRKVPIWSKKSQKGRRQKKLWKNSQADRLGWPPPSPKAVRKKRKILNLSFDFGLWSYMTFNEFYPPKFFWDHRPPPYPPSLTPHPKGTYW